MKAVLEDGNQRIRKDWGCGFQNRLVGAMPIPLWAHESSTKGWPMRRWNRKNVDIIPRRERARRIMALTRTMLESQWKTKVVFLICGLVGRRRVVGTNQAFVWKNKSLQEITSCDPAAKTKRRLVMPMLYIFFHGHASTSHIGLRISALHPCCFLSTEWVQRRNLTPAPAPISIEVGRDVT